MTAEHAVDDRSNGLGQRSALEGHHAATTRPRTSCACAAPCTSNTRWRACGAEKLWSLLHDEPYVNALGRADRQPGHADGRGRPEGDLSVAAGRSRPTPTSPARCIRTSACIRPTACRTWCERINNALRRADQIQHAEGNDGDRLSAADRRRCRSRLRRRAQRLRADEGDDRSRRRGRALRRSAGSAKKCGHMGGKVLVPTREAVDKLTAARLAADVCGVPTVLVARTDAEAADLLTSDVDERDRRSSPASARPKASTASTRGLDQAIARGLAYAPYADLLWCETGTARSGRSARKFAEAIHAKLPGQAARLQLLAVVQLEEEARRRDDRQVPARAGRDGLQVPVHHAGRLPRAELFDVRAGPRLRAQRR